MTYRMTRLGDVLELVRDPVTIRPSEPYRKIGVRGFGRGIFHYPEMPGDQLGKLRFYQLRPDELVISNIKAWEGAIAVSGNEDVPSVASNRFLTYRQRATGNVDIEYVRFLLLSEPGLHMVGEQSPGSVDRNRTLGIKAFEAIEIPLPSIDEQRRVAAHLSRADNTTRACSERVEHQSEVADALVSSLVHRPDLSDRERGSRGWREVSVGDFLRLDIDPVPVEVGVEYPMAGVYSFGRGLFTKPAVVGGETSYKKYHRLHKDQIVLSRLFAWEGAIAKVHKETAGRFVSTEFPTFRVDRDLTSPVFAEALFSSRAFWKPLNSAAEGVGVRRQRVSADRFLASRLWLAPKEGQVAIESVLIGVRELADDADRRALLEGLMPSLLNQEFSHVA